MWSNILRSELKATGQQSINRQDMLCFRAVATYKLDLVCTVIEITGQRYMI